MRPTKVNSIFLALLLALGAAGTASAQSSVNISGLVQLAVARGNGGTSPLYGAGALDGWSVNSETSRIYIAGKEDLGGGLYGAFDLQHFFQADTGAPANFAPGAFWDGRSIVRLGNTMGEIYLGHDYVPLFFTGLAVDPWGWDGSSTQMGLLQWANYLSTAGIRTNNTVGLKTAPLGGVSIQAAASAGEGSVGRGLGVSLTYSSGPLWASAAYDEHANIGASKDSLWMLAAAYDFGVARPGFQFSRSSVGGASYRSASFTLTAPVGPGTLKAGLARLDDADTVTTGKQNLAKISLGYQYPFSKRTAAFVGIASAKQDALTRTTVGEVGLSHSF